MPAMRVDWARISERRSRGEERREEKMMLCSGEELEVMGGVVLGEAVVGAAEEIAGVEEDRMEA